MFKDSEHLIIPMHVSLKHQCYIIEGNWNQRKVLCLSYVYIQTLKDNTSQQIEME